MKLRTLRSIILTFVSVISGASAYGIDCDLPLGVANMTQTEDISQASLDNLSNKLKSIIGENGAVTDVSDSRFFISGRFNHMMDEVLPGPPHQYSVHTELTIYVGDVESETLYGSCTLDLRGIGNSRQRALLNALRSVNGNNPRISNLLNKASDKIIKYYDDHSGQILEKARKAASVQNFEEALYYAFSIPECCKSYGKAVDEGLEYYQKYIDISGRKQYEQARAIWTASQDTSAAHEALTALLNIPVGSSAYPDAEKLAKEIASVVKDDKRFEQRDKYSDAIDIKKMEINSAKEIGVAWGRGQQPKTTNIAWIK